MTGTPDQPASDLRILGNLLGTDRSGATAVVAGQEAVYVAGAVPGVQVGAAGAGNVVVAGAEGGGNRRGGIALLDLGAAAGAPDGATVAGNLIGLTASGSAPLGRIGTGVSVVTDAEERGIEGVTIGGEVGNRIVATLGIGVLGPRSSGTVVQGNTIGLLASGALAREERDTIGLLTFLADHVRVLGNTIGGQAIGVALASDANVVLRNRIGTDPSGTEARPNLRGLVVYGEIDGGRPVGDRNRIGAEGAGNVVSGNERGGIGIGGTFTLPADEALAGAASAAGPSEVDAVSLADALRTSGDVPMRSGRSEARAGERGANENLIAFNRIGTTANGTAQLGNGRGPTVDDSFVGLAIQDGRGNQVIGNVISGNGGGLLVRFDDDEGGDPRETLIAGNVIGGSVNGTLPIPNQYGGVFLAASPGNRLDAAVLSEGGAPTPNLIRGNGTRGLFLLTLDGETGNRIRGTSFVGNEGPSIELLDGGGGYPAVAAPIPQVFWATSADEGGATLRLRADGAGEVDVFGSTGCSGGHAEGRILGVAEVTEGATSLAVPDLLPDVSPLSQFLAVTLTPPGPTATTSAFSDCVRIARPADLAEAAVAEGETGRVLDEVGLRVDVTGNDGLTGATGGTLFASRFGVAPQPSAFAGEAPSPGGMTVAPNAVAADRHWTLRADGLAGVTYAACLDIDGVTGVADPSHLVVLHRADAGAPWTPAASTLDGTRLCAGGFTAWGDLGIGADSLVNPVPSDPGPEGAPEADRSSALALSVAPNPTAGVVTVTLAMPVPMPARIEVIDMLGRRVAAWRREVGDAAAVSLDVSGWPSGVYGVRAVTAAGVASQTLTVVR